MLRHSRKLWNSLRVPSSGSRLVRKLSGGASPSGPHAFANIRDLKFNLYEVLNLTELFETEFYQDHSAESVDTAIETAVNIATQKFAPHNRKADLEEPLFDPEAHTSVIIPEVKEALQAYYDAGFGTANFDDEVGGMQFPFMVTSAMFLPFYAANVGTAAYALLTTGAANLLRAYGSSEQQEKYLKPMLEGRFFGTMNLSETQAGSSLGDIRTRAVPADGEQGAYWISGTKMWISGGEHTLSDNIVHLVLAKVQKPGSKSSGGVKDISLFLVPKYHVNDGSLGERNDVTLAGVNHKMGWRGTVNTVLSYGEQNNCKGFIIGEEGKGLAYMFHMMNEARIGVGMSATALGYAGYAYSLNYARERCQGRDLLDKDPSKPQIPIIQHSDVKRMLLAQKSYVEGSIALCLYASKLVDQMRAASSDEEKERSHLLLELLTPVVKSWPSEWCLEANKWAIQILGGYGYTRDYPVEQYYRDNRLNMIHEGTNGVQSLDLLGRKTSMKKGAAVKVFVQEVERTINDARVRTGSHNRSLEEYASKLEEALALWKQTVSTLLKEGAKNNVHLMLANSHEFLNMTGHLVISWMWLKQATAANKNMPKASPADLDFYNGKLLACRWFFRQELPKTKRQAELLMSLDDTICGWKIPSSRRLALCRREILQPSRSTDCACCCALARGSHARA